MPLSPGDQFGPYTLISAIGRGGMGEVWKARDTRLDRIVAMKFSQGKFNERFERETKAISSLNHPNICQLYDVGRTSWSWSTLRAHLSRGRYLSIKH
jgi:eukaryotic-like serine/threonine-protein kinase